MLIMVAGFAFDDIHNAYESFEASSKHGTLKVVVTMSGLSMNGSSWSPHYVCYIITGCGHKYLYSRTFAK